MFFLMNKPNSVVSARTVNEGDDGREGDGRQDFTTITMTM